MTTHLDPVILQKLRAFARRRRSLILLRGVFATVAMLVGTMIVVAAVDFRIPFLPNAVRWALSVTAYVAVLVVAWRQCLRQLWHAPDERQIARLVEHAEPGLREDLLSAVELGRAHGDVFDSEQFRNLLQTDVSARMQGLEVKALLPVRLIKRTIGVAAVIAVAVIGLSRSSEFRLRTLFLRALLPGANLENVAGTRLIIVEPERGDRTVAQGDTVRVVVEVKGQAARSAMLEAQGRAEGRRLVEMKPLGGNRFATTIQVGRENVRYRMQAGDGITRYYELTAVARPHEIAFAKTHHFPAYTKLAPKTEQGTGGDITALEGTEVEVVITANQAVASGELRLDCGKRATTVPLVVGRDRRLTGRVPITASGTYRVHLVAAGTGFENKFSPEYEVRATPDLPPVVEFAEPGTDIVAPANEVVKLVVRASDDFGVARIVQMVKVNEGAWKEVTLQDDPGKQARVERDWDLAEEGVKTNDLVTTKLVATDFKGHKAESRPLQVVVLAAEIEMKRLGGLESRRVLGECVQAIAAASATMADTARAAQLKFEQTEGADPQRAAALGTCARAVAEYEAKLAQAWLALSPPLLDAPANHESSDLVLLGRLLSRTNSGEVQQAGRLLRLLHASPGQAGGREMAAEIHAHLARARTLSELANEVYRFNLAAEQIDVVFEMSVLLFSDVRRIRGMAGAAKGPGEWGRVATRLNAMLGVSRSLDGVLGALKKGGSPIADDAGLIATGDYFVRVRDETDKALKDGAPDERLKEIFADLDKHFGQVVWDSRTARAHLATAALETITARGKIAAAPVASMHLLLMEELEPTWTCVEKLRAELAEIGKRTTPAAPDRQTLSQARWGAASDIFRSHADLEETRAMADNGFLGDLRRASAATLSVQALAPGDGPEKTAARLETLDQAMRILEGGHELQELADGLVALTALERYEARRPHARSLSPRDWAWLGTRLQMAAGRLKGVALKDEEARRAMDAAAVMIEAIPGSEAFVAVGVEMGQRGKYGRIPESAHLPLEVLATRVKTAILRLRKPLEAARIELAGLTPKISELAFALAREEAALKKDSNRLAGTAATARADDNKDQARPQLAQQQQINGRIEMLKDIIRADASEQNILKKDQRERARDGDDALAMLKDPPPAAEQALLDVTRGSDPGQQQADLDLAIEQEQKLVDVLNQIAGHYASLEQNRNAEDSRTALRENEEALGVKDALDAEYAKAEKLAALAEMSLADQLAALEAQLPTSPSMQKELDQIARDALAVALEELERAARAEASAANRVDEEVTREKDPKYRLTALESARLAATFTKEAQAAADTARQFLEQAANKAALGRAQSALTRATAAVPAADQLVDAVQKLEGMRGADEITAKVTLVMQSAGLTVQLSTQAQAEAVTAATGAAVEAQKGGPEQTTNEEGGRQATAVAEKSARAVEAANQANQAAQLAAERSRALARLPDSAPQTPKLAFASVEQRPVRGDVLEAAADVSRAGRHETRLGKSDAGQKLSELAGEITAAARQEVTAAEQALRESAQPEPAQVPVRTAAVKLAQLVEALKKLQQESNGPAPADPTDPGTDDGRELARALDELDQEINATDVEIPAPGNEETPSAAGPIGGKAPVAAASMRQGRKGKPDRMPAMPGIPPPFNPTPKSEMGAQLAGSPVGGAPPPLAAMKKGTWGNLPKKLAEDLTRGRAEDVPEDYREAIETYYRVIAERSRQP
ncbi:MAG: hypothetical protein K8R23_14160 [Chthoniobacter sp.]|nr:hypothetical protein [Chthoniobacter sp.]